MTLLLTRKANESIVIISPSGEQIVMTVDCIRGGQVSLRYSAPTDYKIWRDELLEHDGRKYKKLPLR